MIEPYCYSKYRHAECCFDERHIAKSSYAECFMLNAEFLYCVIDYHHGEYNLLSTVGI